jgi:hypothetical protein
MAAARIAPGRAGRFGSPQFSKRKLKRMDYKNWRYGFRLTVPDGFEQQGDPDNGDGTRFSSRDGGVFLRAVGRNAWESLSETYRSRVNEARGEIIRQQQAPGHFELTSFDRNANQYVYVKAFCGSGSQNELTIELAAECREKYEPIVNAIIESFRPGDTRESW